MKKVLSAIVAFAFILLPILVLGQQIAAINGRITDDVGNPLPGANVYIQGTSFGAAADVEGFYSFKAPATGQQVTLVGRYMGYQSKSVSITLSTGTITQNIELNLDVLKLEEVVVTGMGGTQIKRKLGMSISSVKPDLVTKADEANVVQSLAGKAPNVEVVQTSGDPGTSSYIRIRGGASIDRATQPLFVVDGVPIDNSTITLANAGVGGTYSGSGTESSNRASDLNVEDIESIEVLKGSAAAAIYGSRASNGVILVTTKSGKPGKTRIDYKFQYGISEMSQGYPLQKWYGKGSNGEYSIHSRYSFGPRLNVPGAPWYDPSQPKDQVWDHSREISDGGYIVDHNITVSGGNNLTTFFLSLGQYFEEGHWKAGSDYKRTTARLKGSQVISEKLRLTGNIMYSNVDAHYLQRADNLSGIGIAALRTPPNFNNLPYLDPVTGLHRSYRYPEAEILKKSRGYDNPFWIMYEMKNPNEVNRLQGYVKAEYDLTKWINLSYHIGSDYFTDERLNILPPSSSRESGVGRIIRGTNIRQEIDANLVATIQGNKFLKRWNFIDGTLMLGQNLNIRKSLQSIMVGIDMGVPNSFNQLDNCVSVTSHEYEWQRNIESYFGQLTFDLFDQLYFTAAARNDGSSTFGKSKKRHWYPKASAAWEFTRFKPIPYVNFGKVRFAYGVAGVQPGVYTTISGYQAGAEGFGLYTNAQLENEYYGKPGFRHSTNLGNDNIKPERTREYEYGLDMSFLNSRLGFELTYYDQRTTDVILDLNVAPSTGSFSQTSNGATITNKGLELAFNVSPVKKRNFSWDMGFIYATNKNKVIDMSGVEWEGFGGSSYAAPGHALGVYRAQSWIRFGHGIMYDLDGDGVKEDIDALYAGQWKKNDVYVGDDGKPILSPTSLFTPWSPNPKWTGSIRNEFTLFGKVTISTLIDIVYKRWMENRGMGQNYKYGVAEATKVRDTEGPINHWFIHGEKAVGPGATDGVGTDFVYDQRWFQTLGGYSGDRWQFIEDAGYVKLREVSISYPLRFDFIRKFGVQEVSVRLSGRNLITTTDYRGWAPDTNRSQASNIRGIDYYNSPQTRVYTFTLRVNY